MSDDNDQGLGADAVFCGKCCDHGSPCLLYADHVPPDRHETQHGCIFYDTEHDRMKAKYEELKAAEIERHRAPIRADLARVRSQRDRLAALIFRARKYAREDRMVTPGVTRLARLLDMAGEVLDEIAKEEP
jgi:hypothetical protein